MSDCEARGGHQYVKLSETHPNRVCKDCGANEPKVRAATKPVPIPEPEPEPIEEVEEVKEN